VSDWGPGDAVSSPFVREAQQRCAGYFRRLGIRDPEVLASMYRMIVRRVSHPIVELGPAQVHARYLTLIIEATDLYVQKWVAGIEKQIDLHGGVSRCGEIAMQMPMVLASSPWAIESVEAAVPCFAKRTALRMPAQPPNNPTHFADQPLTASAGGALAELWLSLVNVVRQGFASTRPSLMPSISLDRRDR